MKHIGQMTPAGTSMWRARVGNGTNTSITFYSPFAPMDKLQAHCPRGRPLVGAIINEGCFGRIGVCLFENGRKALWIENDEGVRVMSMDSMSFSTQTEPLVCAATAAMQAIVDTINLAWSKVDPLADRPNLGMALMRGMVPAPVARRIYGEVEEISIEHGRFAAVA